MFVCEGRCDKVPGRLILRRAAESLKLDKANFPRSTETICEVCLPIDKKEWLVGLDQGVMPKNIGSRRVVFNVGCCSPPRGRELRTPRILSRNGIHECRDGKSTLQLISRNHKTSCLGNCHDGICISCCLEFLLKTSICFDGFQEGFKLLF